MGKNQTFTLSKLLCSTKPCPNKRPEIDKLIVKITFYDNVGNSIIGFCNIMVELNLIISFINNKKYNQTHLFFSKLHEECCGESFYSYERKDNQSLSEDLQKNLINMVNTFSQKITNIIISNNKLIY